MSALTIATLAIAIAVIRWLAPQLLGLPVDLRLVRVSETQPPFFDNVFRPGDYRSTEFLVNDPITVVRAKPRLPERGDAGPHDVLGFRNRTVPNVADIVVIGDSQTYGNGAALEENWPSRLRFHLADIKPVVYSMATGGWGAVQYLDMVTKATSFQPMVIIVAFYSGNDAIETFRVAYGVEQWADLRVDPGLDSSDAPKMVFPVREDGLWPVQFNDGSAMVFTPALRLAANEDHPAVAAGYRIMAGAATEMSRSTAVFRTPLVFTIIPTKELVYAPKVRRESIAAPGEYGSLVEAEARRIEDLANHLAGVQRAMYVDVLGPLQQAALTGRAIYPSDQDGHPLPAGAEVIGRTLAKAARRFVPDKPEGLAAIRYANGATRLLLVKPNGVWVFPSPDLAVKNGWKGDFIIVSPRSIEGLPRCGVIEGVDPERFGPGSLETPGTPCDT